MSNATTNSVSGATTIRPEEAAHFGKLAAEWWDPKGSSAMLHRLNPVRLGFIRDAIDAHWGSDQRDLHADTGVNAGIASNAQAPRGLNLRPLSGKTALDVGCGAGLLCEPLARLGANVTGVDAAAENIAAASEHAKGSGLAITYRCGDVGSLGLSGFDLVSSMEVIEHVADKAGFIAALVAALADDGLMILSTPNRTPQSKWLMIEAAERLGMVPRGTHHWEDFITPAELAILLEDAGMQVGQPMGIAWSPMKGLHLSNDLALNYILTARKR